MSTAPAAESSRAAVHATGLDVVVVDLDAAQELLEREEASTPRLSNGDRLRVDRLSGDLARQSLWRSARIATRIVLERAAGPDVRGKEFDIAAGGRPELGAGFPYFNVSHSGGAALIAVCRSRVGVDIERRRPLSMSIARRRRVLDAARLSGSDPHSEADVLRAWVRLEAVAKARGSGIGVILTEAGVIGGAVGSRKQTSSESLCVSDLDAGADYIAAIAADRLPPRIDVRRFPASAAELAEFLQTRRA